MISLRKPALFPLQRRHHLAMLGKMVSVHKGDWDQSARLGMELTSSMTEWLLTLPARPQASTGTLWVTSTPITLIFIRRLRPCNNSGSKLLQRHRLEKIPTAAQPELPLLHLLHDNPLGRQKRKKQTRTSTTPAMRAVTGKQMKTVVRRREEFPRVKFQDSSVRVMKTGVALRLKLENSQS